MRLLSLFCILLFSFASNGQVRCWSDLEVRDSLTYLIGYSEPYTGQLVTKYRNGQTQDSVFFYEGLLVSIMEYSKKQKAKVETALRSDHSYSVTWYKGALKETEGHYLREEREGVWTWYYKSGQPKKEITYTNGQSSNIYKQWNRKGELTLVSIETVKKQGMFLGIKTFSVMTRKVKTEVPKL